MKHVSLLILVLLFSPNNFAQEQTKESKKLYIEIDYFHRTERCASCLSIEENIQKVLDQYFVDEVKSGKLSFYTINYEEKEDTAKINKFYVDAPILVITRYKKGKEKTKGLTAFAFDNSLHNPEKFMNGFRDEINEMFR